METNTAATTSRKGRGARATRAGAVSTPAGWLHANGVDLAPLTGQDRRMLEAIAACWEAYASADDDGRDAVVGAVRSLLLGMQPKCRPLTKKLIARALDWSDVEVLWPEVSS